MLAQAGPEADEAVVVIHEALLPGVTLPAAVFVGHLGDEARWLLARVLGCQDVRQDALLQQRIEIAPRKHLFRKAQIFDADGVDAMEELAHAVLCQHPLQPLPVDLSGVFLGKEGPVEQLAQGNVDGGEMGSQMAQQEQRMEIGRRQPQPLAQQFYRLVHEPMAFQRFLRFLREFFVLVSFADVALARHRKQAFSALALRNVFVFVFLLESPQFLEQPFHPAARAVGMDVHEVVVVLHHEAAPIEDSVVMMRTINLET